MAAHLIKARHDVTVWNRTADATKPLVAAGATQAQTRREAAAGAAFVVAMVRYDDASRRVWLDPGKAPSKTLPLPQDGSRNWATPSLSAA
jgi:3-hydroxyisobutyrate dehydrogenase